MKRACLVCGAPVTPRARGGRLGAVCSNACRLARRRAVYKAQTTYTTFTLTLYAEEVELLEAAVAEDARRGERVTRSSLIREAIRELLATRVRREKARAA